MRRIVVLLSLAACQVEPRVSETEQHATGVSPGSTDFGAIQVGMTSGSSIFTINPTSISTQTVTSITESCPDFDVSAPGLPAQVYRVCLGGGGGGPIPFACTEVEQEGYSFYASFHPIVGGATSCVVTIAISSGNKSVTLFGTGTIPPVDISVSPGNVNFGDVRRNTASSPAQIIVRNNGGATMTVSSASASAGFAMTSGPGSTTVAAGGQQAYTVACQPGGLGPMSGAFTVVSDDPDTGTVNIPLACNGIDSNLDISPSPAQLPVTRVGEPAESTIQLVNSGAASMTITSVALDSTTLSLVSAPNPGTTLAGSGGSAPVGVRFAAADATAATGTLTVVYDGSVTRTSQISARALATSMALTPDGDVDLGPICLGQMKAQPFNVLANAEGPFQITAISSPEAPFTVTAPTLPASVRGSGGTASFEVQAQPAAAGPLASTIEVTTDIPSAAPRTIRLTAVALGAGVSGTPELLDMGEQVLDVTTIGREISIANCTETGANLANARIEGLDAASFAIVQQPATAALGPSAIAKWLVVFTPREAGHKEATFVVDHEAGSTIIPLTGEGLGPLGAEGPKGYYACSTGGATALWPIALALGLLLRRRRR